MTDRFERLIVVGDGEVADPLLHVVDVLRYPTITRTDDLPADLGQRDHVVLVTPDLGQQRRLVRQALAAGCTYVGVVVSGPDGARLSLALQKAGVTAEELARVAVPAGLELGAASPGEIAIAIGAELVKARHGTRSPRPPADGRN
jgi:xanthine dehydrogenase accessory factor